MFLKFWFCAKQFIRNKYWQKHYIGISGWWCVGQSLQQPSIGGKNRTPPEINSLTAAWMKLSVWRSCSRCFTASPQRVNWREECLWEVEHFIMRVALFVHLLLNLSGLREAASNPLCCRHCLPLQLNICHARQWCTSTKSHLPLSSEKIKAPVMLPNTTTSIVFAREVFPELSTQVPEAEDHFWGSNCGSPKWGEGTRIVLNHAPMARDDNLLLQCWLETSPYEISVRRVIWQEKGSVRISMLGLCRG